MYSSSSCIFSFDIILSIFSVTSLLMIHKTASTSNVLGYFCSNTTMFANNSAFETNLNTVFRSLSSNTTNNPTGFDTVTSENSTSEAIYGRFMCRGDQNSSSCHGCVTTATTKDLPNNCPNRKSSVIWYDECMVRYSNESFLNQMDTSPSMLYWSANSILGNASLFYQIVSNMMNNEIAVRAAEGGSLKKFATAVANVSSPIPQTIYGLGQCTPDLSDDSCYTCLSSAFKQMRNDTQGGRSLTPSCVVRYETFSFFDLSSLPQPPQPAPTSHPPQSRETPSTNVKKKVAAKLLVPIIVALVLVVSAAVSTICICLFKKNGKKDDVVSSQHDSQEFAVESLQYDLTALQNATNGFSDENKLGEGGFGGVYKGTLPDGQVIAVKRLSASSSQGLQEFKSEVVLVAKLQHRNLVRLLGFCITPEEKLLVYEHVPNKSLNSFLFDQEKQTRLDWGTRYNIIRGIARGMLYLHHDSQLRIIHRDLKASNVLLDLEMNPKISDFGTAKIFGGDQSQSNYTNKVVGTYGYMAPEYVLHGKFSMKSDVYSFGALVLEIISGRRICSVNQLADQEDLLTYVWKQWRSGTLLECVDQTIRDSCSYNEVLRCIHLAILCVQESIEERPSMVTVVLSLDSLTVTLPVPQEPSFFARTRVVSTPSSGDGSIKSLVKSIAFTVNDDSVTELVPR